MSGEEDKPIASRLRRPHRKRAASPHKKHADVKSTGNKANSGAKKQNSQEFILTLLEEQKYLPKISNDIKKVLAEYLTFNSIGEEDPLLIVQLLPRIGVLNQNAGFQQNVALIVAGLTANGAENVQNMNCIFKFNCWNDLYLARSNLRNANQAGNVSWAFFLSQDSASALGYPQGIPTANTAVISFFSEAQARLTIDSYDFFAL
jgi:hypothetical protein